MCMLAAGRGAPATSCAIAQLACATPTDSSSSVSAALLTFSTHPSSRVRSVSICSTGGVAAAPGVRQHPQ